MRILTWYVGGMLLAFVLLCTSPVHAAMQAPTSVPAQGILQPTEEIGTTVHIAGIEQEGKKLAISVNETGLETTAGPQGAGIKGEDKLPVVIGKIIRFALGMVGVVFLVIMIYGGFLYLTAGGNKDQVGKAVDYIKNGAIGLVIIFASYAITNFVVGSILDSTAGTTATTLDCSMSTGKPAGCACGVGTECASNSCDTNKGQCL